MEHPALKAFENSQMRNDLPFFQAGDTIRVNTRVVEGEKERIQVFEGVVIARAGSGLGETFTIRKISSGVGVERCFPIHSPRIESINVVRRGRVRRAKLYYLRERSGKGTRIPARRKKLRPELVKGVDPRYAKEPDQAKMAEKVEETSNEANE